MQDIWTALLLVSLFGFQLAAGNIIDKSHCEALMTWPPYFSSLASDGMITPSVTCWPLEECTSYPGVERCTAAGNITHLDFSLMHLDGSLPSGWSSVMTQLISLRLDGNKLAGDLPSSWQAFPKLATLNLSDNPSLTGPLPSEWLSMPSLRELDITNTGVATPAAPSHPPPRRLFPCNTFRVVSKEHPKGIAVHKQGGAFACTQGIIIGSMVGAVVLLVVAFVALWRAQAAVGSEPQAADMQQWLLA